MVRPIALTLCCAVCLLAQNKYTGPRPTKADVPYLLHASNLISTEVGEAKEESRKDELANVMRGASSPARTPLAEPIFLLLSDKIAPEKLELYKTTVKNGNREVTIPSNPKKRREMRPIKLSFTKLETGLYRLEVNEELENGEYCLSPSGSMQVFCFQVY